MSILEGKEETKKINKKKASDWGGFETKSIVDADPILEGDMKTRERNNDIGKL